MGKTYNAILRGNQLEWKSKNSPVTTPKGVEVQVTIIEDTYDVIEEHPMDIMERIAQTSKTPWPDDPVAWQREIRQDRPLPGRE